MSLSGIIRSSTVAKAVAISLVLVGLLALPGCWVTSINPLYEEGFLSPKDPDLVFDQNLTGSWSLTNDKCTTGLTITSKDEIYDLQSTEQGEGCSTAGEKSRQQARLVKLDTYYFLDVSPREDDVCDMCLARHSIFLAKFDKETLTLTPIDSDWLAKSLAAKTITLVTLSDDTNTLTASSKDLKSFCRRFAGNQEVFTPESTETFKRK